MPTPQSYVPSSDLFFKSIQGIITDSGNGTVDIILLHPVAFTDFGGKITPWINRNIPFPDFQ
jgi:hypothetical protein